MTAPNLQPVTPRLRDLYALRLNLDTAIRHEEALARRDARDRARVRRPRNVIPDCGTESAYQRHRYMTSIGREEKLDPADVCGCLAAHREHVRAQRAATLAARRGARRRFYAASAS